MKISSWKRLTKSDFPDMPEWFEPILDRINEQMGLVTSALSGNLTFEDNFLSEKRTLEIPHDTATSIELQRIRRSPSGVVRLSESEFDYSRVAWRVSETRERSVDVKLRYDVAPTKTPVATLLFLG